MTHFPISVFRNPTLEVRPLLNPAGTRPPGPYVGWPVKMKFTRIPIHGGSRCLWELNVYRSARVILGAFRDLFYSS